MNTPHARAQLSAYLDGALAPSEREAVEAHLATCVDCRTRLAELRATANLIRALPELRPSRRLVPRVAARPGWLAPLRTLSTLASGVSVFLFLATALLSNVSQFAATSAPAAAPAPAAGGAATAASSAPAFGAASGAADTATRNVSSGAPAVAPSPGAAAPTTTSGAGAEKQATTTASPSAGAQLSVSSPSAQDRGGAPVAERVAQPSRSIFGMPWLWLALAVITGALAIALQRRLRSA
jgi:anti-sigma factor RsiW